VVRSTHDGRSDCVSQVADVRIQRSWLESPSFEQVDDLRNSVA
jgi:hypothetical protein